jgi:hypothetical protein
MFPPLGILSGKSQPEKAAVWILTTQDLESTGRNTIGYISAWLQTITVRKSAIARDIIE